MITNYSHYYARYILHIILEQMHSMQKILHTKNEIVLLERKIGKIRQIELCKVG